MKCTLGTVKMVRDSEKFDIVEFEITSVFIRSQTVNAEGTDGKVRDSEKFEIVHSRDSESWLYIQLTPGNLNLQGTRENGST